MMPVGYTIRTSCGKGRITYDPVWSPSKPWQTFENGTATNSFPELSQAMRRMKEKGWKFPIKEEATV